MKLRSLVLTAAAAACFLTACTSVHSTMSINGHQFGPDQCRTGQDAEFFGVDLKDDPGTTLRLVANPDETVDVIVIPDDGTEPIAMAGCANLDLRPSSRDSHGYYTIDGNATVSCTGAAYTVVGTTEFQDCHHDY